MQIVYQVFKKVPLRIDQNAISSEKFVFFLSDPSSGGNSLSTPFHSLPPIKLSGSDEGDMYKSGISDTKTSNISETKQFRAKVTKHVYRNLCTGYRLVTNLET